jgi:hypothetical protein
MVNGQLTLTAASAKAGWMTRRDRLRIRFFVMLAILGWRPDAAHKKRLDRPEVHQVWLGQPKLERRSAISIAVRNTNP